MTDQTKFPPGQDRLEAILDRLERIETRLAQIETRPQGAARTQGLGELAEGVSARARSAWAALRSPADQGNPAPADGPQPTAAARNSLATAGLVVLVLAALLLGFAAQIG